MKSVLIGVACIGLAIPALAQEPGVQAGDKDQPQLKFKGAIDLMFDRDAVLERLQQKLKDQPRVKPRVVV